MKKQDFSHYEERASSYGRMEAVLKNLLKSDFYRLFRSKAFYICTLISTLLFMAGPFILQWSMRMIAKSQNSDVIPELPYKSGISYGFTSFSSSDVHLFMAILIAIFVTAEFMHGTMKNVVSKGFPKTSIYISKLITMTAASHIMILMMLAFGVLAGTIVTGAFKAPDDDFLLLFRMAGIEVLLHAALTSVFVMTGMVIRNTGGVIAVNIIGIFTLGPIIYQILDLLFKPKTSFTSYGLQYNINAFQMNLVKTASELTRAIAVAVIFFAVTSAAGILFFRKMDIK